MDSIQFAPLVPWGLIAGLACAMLVPLALAAVRRGRGVAWRALVAATLVLVLANPRAVNEHREPRPDVAVVVIDDSDSQKLGHRRDETRKALDDLRASLQRFSDLEVRVVHAGTGGNETRLFDALGRALAEVPRQRVAGVFLITDGQVHDVPADLEHAQLPHPLHVLLTGHRGEADRRLAIETTPSYGLVGKPATIVYRVEDRPVPAAAARGWAQVRLRRDGIEIGAATVPVGTQQRFTFTLEHAGATIVEIEAATKEGELSPVNNKAVITINGVRERLRVLLISGQPHAGERTWRNILKSDPSVDLVHFTILRPPEKDDMTPLRELALIVFPVQELFEVKLREFNLIIFDRYMVRDILPPSYMRNVEAYVRDGGAVLMAVGPEFAGLRSLFQTPLGEIMPGAPTGQVLEGAFRPAITELGRRHPVTDLVPVGLEGRPRWGRWFRQVDAQARAGSVLMSGLDEHPLLILDRVGKGRVAQVMSDQMWLWARGFEGGGPQTEMLRRLAHWLMKEPELEEESLTAQVKDRRLTIERRSLETRAPTVSVTAPSGTERTVTLEVRRGGRFTATVPAEEVGLYRVNDGERTALAASGSINTPELADLRATDERLAAVAAATGGGLAWVAEDGLPELRRTRPGRVTAGRGWMGLARNEAYVVTGILQVALLPAALVLALLLAGLTAAWWREGR